MVFRIFKTSYLDFNTNLYPINCCFYLTIMVHYYSIIVHFYLIKESLAFLYGYRCNWLPRKTKCTGTVFINDRGYLKLYILLKFAVYPRNSFPLWIYRNRKYRICLKNGANKRQFNILTAVNWLLEFTCTWITLKRFCFIILIFPNSRYTFKHRLKGPEDNPLCRGQNMTSK